jgi:excisionase family DNA binding protein
MSSTAIKRRTNSNVYKSVDELAETLGVSRASIYAGLKTGEIPAIRWGRRYILPRAAIAEWLRTAGNRPLGTE